MAHIAEKPCFCIAGFFSCFFSTYQRFFFFFSLCDVGAAERSSPDNPFQIIYRYGFYLVYSFIQLRFFYNLFSSEYKTIMLPVFTRKLFPYSMIAEIGADLKISSAKLILHQLNI